MSRWEQSSLYECIFSNISPVFCYFCFCCIFKNRDGEQAMEENELLNPERSRTPSEEDLGENSTVCEQVRLVRKM